MGIRREKWSQIGGVWVALAALALLLLAIKPIFYVGGGADDYHYVAAAQCWVENGPCLPANHWQTRWPLIAPIAASLWLFGESRMAAGLAPFLFTIGVLGLFALLVTHHFGPRAALIGGAALLLTPVLALMMAQPNVDVAEAFFLLGGSAAWMAALRSGRRGWAALAGVALAAAVQTRETSLVYLLLFGGAFLLLPRADKKVMLWALPGFAVPIMAEMFVHWLSAGDPLLRYRLALGHTRIPSSELMDGVDTSRSPLMNPDFIAGWSASNGIEAHWTVKPLVNLLSHPLIGFTLLSAIMLLVLVGRTLSRVERSHAIAALLLPAAGALLLIYVLAVDPKPRTFLPLLIGAAAVIGVAASRGWNERRLPVLTAGAIIVVLGVPKIAVTPDLASMDEVAAAWMAEQPGPVAVDENSRRHLLLLPERERMVMTAADRRLHFSRGPCEAQASGGEAVVHDALIVPGSEAGSVRRLCLFERSNAPRFSAR